MIEDEIVGRLQARLAFVGPGAVEDIKDAIMVLQEQGLAIHRLRESMRVLSYLNPNTENIVTNPWLVAAQVSNYVNDERHENHKRIAELELVLHRISLASQNSMSSKEECGRIARTALENKQ